MPTNQDINALSTLSAKLALTPEKIQFAHYLALPKAKRPKLEEMAINLGVNHTTLWRWKKNKRVLTLAKELMKRYFVDDLADILEAMKTKALQGDTQAARLVIEYIEDYMKAKKEVSNNTQVNIFVSKEDVQARIKQLKEKIIDN